jgi:hypothetical protein
MAARFDLEAPAVNLPLEPLSSLESRSFGGELQ